MQTRSTSWGSTSEAKEPLRALSPTSRGCLLFLFCLLDRVVVACLILCGSGYGPELLSTWLASQSFTVPSRLAEARRWPSGLKVRHATASGCLLNESTSCPVAVFQIFTVPS